MNAPFEASAFDIQIDKSGPLSLAEQIHHNLRTAIMGGSLRPGSRLPSWRDLAAQLGVARGTVRVAYEGLLDEHLIVTAGAAGTYVSEKPVQTVEVPDLKIARPLETIVRGFGLPVLPFQTGVPAQDAFPAKLWARVHARAVRAEASASTSYPDPRGNNEFRSQIASYIAIARGIHCDPDQIIVTSGFRAGLALTLHVLGAFGRTALIEDPGFPMTRWGLELAGMKAAPIPVDSHGMDVSAATLYPDAYLAVVTPGQHAPTGVAMSKERRNQLLSWAAKGDRWIIEDDYLSELQLAGRAAPALASEDTHGKVIHIGSFSKTLKPSLSLGFVVVPAEITSKFGEAAAYLSPSLATATQLAVTRFIAEGNYLRHLRHMKRLYAARRDALLTAMRGEAAEPVMAGLAVLIPCPQGTSDVDIARRAVARNLSPMPLSPWYANPTTAKQGLILGVTNLRETAAKQAWTALKPLLETALTER
ncbi:PLP-dependent aminotransferase family protein [Bradyrhizobium sp. LTSPM299]|uniref:MocR-like pyridoxine biosynthesis transcription factor PdxR n=1 Tax=Bradyrhizobium sp. LTSPM299 TaxID=1619233 RepID=UPI0005C8977E|nr:PLP-dependent aminotransferase family protein [Bradyrhizobium sp. LTSPM299]